MNDQISQLQTRKLHAHNVRALIQKYPQKEMMILDLLFEAQSGSTFFCSRVGLVTIPCPQAYKWETFLCNCKTESFYLVVPIGGRISLVVPPAKTRSHIPPSAPHLPLSPTTRSSNNRGGR